VNNCHHTVTSQPERASTFAVARARYTPLERLGGKKNARYRIRGARFAVDPRFIVPDVCSLSFVAEPRDGDRCGCN